MLTTIYETNGTPLNAKVEVHDGSIVVHSRGGAYGKPNLRNPDHRRALSLILERLKDDPSLQPEGVWLDSLVAQSWSKDDRRLVDRSEFAQSVEQLVTTIGKRGAEKGRPANAAGHGNSTKRVRIEVNGTRSHLYAVVSGERSKETKRVSAEIQRRVEAPMIDEAIVSLLQGRKHAFQESRDYDLLLPTGERLAPKAVFGLALEKIIGRPAIPGDFSAGWGEPCFQVIEEAGYQIVSKADTLSSLASDRDEERSWAEGNPKLVWHLRRERAPGLAARKKRQFINEHGRLFCERCHVIPSEALGVFGDSCIEVHHNATAVARMDSSSRTRLEDLKCLCANCHRIVHREDRQFSKIELRPDNSTA